LPPLHTKALDIQYKLRTFAQHKVIAVVGRFHMANPAPHFIGQDVGPVVPLHLEFFYTCPRAISSQAGSI
jgi:hypothetical protein